MEQKSVNESIEGNQFNPSHANISKLKFFAERTLGVDNSPMPTQSRLAYSSWTSKVKTIKMYCAGYTLSIAVVITLL
jgi:hypothetical protein